MLQQRSHRDTTTGLPENYHSGLTLPREFYLAPDILALELEHIFYQQWLFIGQTCEIPNPGDYFVVPVGTESIIIVRDKTGEIRAHFNVCRHRGSRLLKDERGCTKSLICPYHYWIYGLDGNLNNARLMGEDFDKHQYSLHGAHLREVAGLLFLSLADDPPDFEPARAAIEPQLAPHQLENTQIIARHQYRVNANWKTIIENNRECYHCQVAHPEFTLSNYDLGLPGDSRENVEFDAMLQRKYAQWDALGLCPREVSFPNGEWFRVSRYPLKPGFLTESMDGQLTAPLMGALTTPDVGSLRLVGLPNFWGHANADYAMTTRLLPISVDETQIDVTFMVRADAQEGTDFDAEIVAKVWKLTSEEDWELCENNYAGIRSRTYQPGPLSPLAETSVTGFIDWYLERIQLSHAGS
jgi:glycine betaine catabolism A